MILHTNGSVEGTPEEIAKWNRLQKDEKKDRSVEDSKAGCVPFISEKIKINTVCPRVGQSCYCTGACMGANEAHQAYLYQINQKEVKN